jgi:hypothetical protein
VHMRRTWRVERDRVRGEPWASSDSVYAGIYGPGLGGLGVSGRMLDVDCVFVPFGKVHTASDALAFAAGSN